MNFSGFYGNTRAKEYLSAAFARRSVPHALLLSGEKGIGKKTLAAIIAQALVCANDEQPPCGVCPACKKALKLSHPDIIRLGGDAVIKVEEIRALKRDALMRPNDAARKVYIIDRAETLTHAAQDALLKILEEPPVFTFFILLCYNHNDLLPTILSRTAHIALAPLSEADFRLFLRETRPTLSESECAEAIRRCGGIPGAFGKPDEDASLSCAEAVASALASGDELRLFEAMQALEKLKRDGIALSLEALLRIVHDSILLTHGLPDAPDGAAVSAISARFSPRDCLRIIDCITEAQRRCTQNVGASHITGSLLCRLAELAV